jgi:hypothetical protein
MILLFIEYRYEVREGHCLHSVALMQLCTISEVLMISCISIYTVFWVARYWSFLTAQ